MSVTFLSRSREGSIPLHFPQPGTFAGRTHGIPIGSLHQPRTGSSTTRSFTTVPMMPRKSPVPVPFRHPGTYASPSTGTSASSTPKSTSMVPSAEKHALTGFGARFYNRTRSVYLGTSSAIIIPTARTPVVALRAVRKDKTSDEPVASAAPPAQPAKKVLRRTQSTGSYMHRGNERDPANASAPLLQGNRAMPSESPSAFGIMCVQYGGPPASRTGMEDGPLPVVGESKASGAVRPVAGYFYRLDAEDADLDDMPEVREALHVNAGICAMGYRYECAQEITA
ncbi:hypothetical protein B0H12DRAFT_1231894 [Mycena haematopus]|nr:hypothetical protein B0H12DRAFT_1231894 [Mycena haematopus]